MLITFEGPEGCGKSTQIKLLKEYFKAKGKSVLVTCEPSGKIREILLDPKNKLANETEIYLFAADRSEHVAKVIKPALAAGKVVLSDRYVDSTIAYQVGGRGLPEDFVRYLNMTASSGLIPDLTILLDVAPEIGLKRAAKVNLPDRFEQEQVAFHARVRKTYLTIAKNEPERVKVINTDKLNIDQVKDKIRQIVEELD